MGPARGPAGARAIVGVGVVGSGLALAVVSALARDIGIEDGAGIQPLQVAGLAAAGGIVVAGAWLAALSRTLTVLVVAAVLVGVLDAWAFRDLMGADGVQYLDIGDAYFDGDIGSAVNAYWSPLYSIVTGLVLAVVETSPTTEFAALRVANLAIYLATLLAFAFFVRELIRYRDAYAIRAGGGERVPAFMVWAIALVAFGWGVGRLVGSGRATPDLLVALLWFVAMALLVRGLRETGSTRTLVALGLVLGVAYLAKTAMFPIGLTFVAVLVSADRTRRGLRRGLIVLAAMAVVALPWVVVVSAESDRPTFGSTSDLNYAWYVSGDPHPQPFLPSEEPLPALANAPRRLLDEPPAFAFDEPVQPATFPPWYDPTYWYDGTEPSLDAGAQVDALRTGWGVYRDMFRAVTGPALIAAFALLVLASVARRRELRGPAPYWRLLVPAAFAVAMYAAVHVENRFVGGYFTTSAVIGLAVLPWPSAGRARTFATAVVAALVAVGLLSNLRIPIDTAARGQANVEAARDAAEREQEAAIALRRLGCRRLALIAPAHVQVQTYFPRLAGMSIVAGVTRPPRDWSDTARLHAALSRTRAQLLVGRNVPSRAHGSWLRLGSSDWFVDREALGSARGAAAPSARGPGCSPR